MPLPFSRTKLIFAVLLVALGLGLYFLLHWGEESTDDASIEAHVVTISPKISGYVKAVHIEDNQRVKAGDLLLEIDPRDYVFRRDKAQALLDAARAAYHASAHNLDTTRISAPSNLEAAAAQAAAAEANWKKAASDLARIQSLSREARSREQLDAAIAAEKATHAAFEDAQARLRSAKTAPKVIASAQASSNSLAAQIKEAQAELDAAQLDLDDTKIYAAQDGKITRHSFEQGDYVQSGQQLGFIVGRELWVVANFKETQLKNMHIGDRVGISVDAFPSLKLSGKVKSMQAGTGARFSAFPPENATGNFVKVVQRVPVKIIFDQQPEPSFDIGPGMSVVPTVHTR